jgi:hypothetical protein
MAKSRERDPQLESMHEGRKRGISLESGRRLGVELAFTHGIARRAVGLIDQTFREKNHAP